MESITPEAAGSAFPASEKAFVRVETERGNQMIEAYPVEQVADKYLPHMKDRVRWMKRRLKKGEIPGKQLSRSVWVMTDAHIEQWLSGGPSVAHQDPVEPVSLADGLSARSRRRLAAS